MDAMQPQTSAVLHLHLLGNPQLLLGQRPLALETAKARALLFYLAITGQRHRREVLVDLLWGEMAEASARRNLTATLTSLRRELAPYLLVEADGIAFNRTAPHFIDVLHFQRLLAAGRSGGDLSPVREAVALYQGDFLAGFTVRNADTFEEWAALQREQLREQMLSALQLLLDEAVGRADYASGLDYANHLLAMDPWREVAHRQLMILHAQSGRRDAALAQFELCRRILAEELGVDPMPETLSLHARLLAASAPPAHNLPPQPNHFVGRANELSQIHQHLGDSACRLLTITGPGGIGKTRLAIEAARLFIAPDFSLSTLNFVDGVYFAPLAGIAGGVRHGAAASQRHGESLIAAIADAVSFTFQSGGDQRRQLLNFLQPKTLLLILDNFEHLLGEDEPTPALDLVEAILRHAPDVKLLVTSRERLNLQEEWVMEISGLDCPPATAEERSLLSLATASQFSAVALFLQRAAQVQIGLKLAEEDAPHVVRLCQLLAGMPLGLELAATWLRDLSCAEIVGEIERGMDFLTTSLRNLPARHRSLRAVFDHSWQMLTEQEQRVMCRLSIFRGGISREAAAQVAGASVSMLARLADKSLLFRPTDPSGRGRYDMHEMIRQFARAQLAAQPGEEAACRLAHGRFFAHWTQQQEANFFNSQQVEMLRFMRLEADNLRAAWQHVVALQAISEVEAFHQGLAMFFSEESWHSEGIELLQQAVDWLEKTPGRTAKEDRLLASLLWIQGALHVQIGEMARAETLELRCLDLAKQINESTLVARAAYRLTQIYVARSEVKTALAYAQEALALFRSLEDRRGIANIFAILGDIYGRTGNYADATQYLQAALEFLRQQGDFSSMARVLSALGANMVIVGNFAQAREHLEEAHQLRERVGGLVSLPDILLNLGLVAEAAGDYDGAHSYWEAGLAAARKLGPENTYGAYMAAWHLNLLSKLRCSQGNYREAEQLAGAARAIYEKLGRRDAIGMSLNALGSVRQAQHALDEAERYYRQAYTIAREFDDHRGVATALNHLGENALLQQDGASARTYFIEALMLAHKINTAPLAMSILTNLAASFACSEALPVAVYILTFVNAQASATYQTRSRAQGLLTQYTQQMEAALLMDLQAKALAARPEDIVARILAEVNSAGDGS